MSFDQLYADSIEAGIQRQIDNPGPAPETSFSVGSMLAGGLKGPVAAGLEVGGSALDALGAAERETARRPRPSALRGQPGARRGSVSGDTMRAKAAEYAPNPETAHAAEQVLFGLTRLGAKAVGAVAAAGPIGGGALLAAEETNTVFRGLVDKGIDKDTALKAAAVQGAVTGVSIALPMVGPTIKSTIGLAAAGGPAAYMGQEAAVKRILEKAGYADEASLHNPFDPVGLAISTLLPAGFAGLQIRNLSRAAPKPLPTIRTEEQIPGAAALSREEQAFSDEFERSAGNLAELRAAIKSEKNPESRALLEAELAKQTDAATASATETTLDRAAATPEVVDAARVRVTDDAMARNLPDIPAAHAEVLRATDELAAGRVPDVAPVESALAPFEEHLARSVDPESLTFRESDQSRLSQVRADFPDDYYHPAVVIREADGGRSILDGHNRATVAAERGHELPIVGIPRAQYDALREAGFDDMEITHAVLSRAGERDAADSVHQQFPGASVEREGGKALDFLDEHFPLPERADVAPAAALDVSRREGTNALPDALATEAASAGGAAREVDPKPARTQAKTIELRKRESVLKSLLECLNG